MTNQVLYALVVLILQLPLKDSVQLALLDVIDRLTH